MMQKVKLEGKVTMTCDVGIETESFLLEDLVTAFNKDKLESSQPQKLELTNGHYCFHSRSHVLRTVPIQRGPLSSDSSGGSTECSPTDPLTGDPRQRRKAKKRHQRKIKFENFACFLDAAWQGDLHEVRTMIEEEGIEPDSCNADGVTALHCAAACCNLELAEYLLQVGANANVPDDHGWTPLHSAAYNNHHELVQVLVAHGADVEALDNQGQSPISLPTAIELIRYLGDVVSRKGSNECVTALYDFDCRDVENAQGDELSQFQRGDRLRILSRNDPNWWLAQHGTFTGYIPRQFVQ